MKNLFLGSDKQEHEGFQHEFWEFCLKHRGFEPYWLDYSKKKRLFARLALKHYDTIWAEDGARGFIALIAKNVLPLCKRRMRGTEIITRFHRPFRIEYEERGWRTVTAIHESSKIASVYNAVKELGECHPLVKPGKFHIVHNGLDLAHFHISDKDFRDKKTILFISGLWEKKRLELLLEAMKHLDGYRLIVGGDWVSEDYKKKIMEIWRSLPKEKRERVIFRGWISYEEKPFYMNLCGVFAMPSTWETWSTQVMEAMACGSPVLITKGYGATDYVPEEQLLPLEITPFELAERIKQVSSRENNWENRLLTFPYGWDQINREVDEVLEDG